MGLPHLGPPNGSDPPSYLILIPILFALALWLRRIPRNVALLVALFVTSHAAAILTSVPWSYGFKTIVPFHLALLVALAFLLPEQRAESSPRGGREIGASPGIATIVIDAALTPAAIQRAVLEADADFCLFADDGRVLSSDVQKLLAYAGEFDVVDGIAISPSALGWLNRVVAKYVGYLYGELRLADASGGLRHVRRELAEVMVGKITVRILSGPYSLIQVPVSSPSSRRPSVLEALRAMSLATFTYFDERRRSGAPRHSATFAEAESQPGG